MYAPSNVAADAFGFVDFEDAETWSNEAHAGESEDAKPVKVGVRAVSGEQIAEVKVDVDASMGQFFAKLRAQQFDSDELKQFEKQGILVLLTSASLGVFGDGRWWMSNMYCRSRTAVVRKSGSQCQSASDFPGHSDKQSNQ